MRSSARGRDFWAEFLTVDSTTHGIRLLLVFLIGAAIGSAWASGHALAGQAHWFLSHCEIRVTGMALRPV